MSEKLSSHAEWRKNENDKTRIYLEGIGKELVEAGFTVHWSASTASDEPALIVNGTCLVRSNFSKDSLLGKFWYNEDQELKNAVTTVMIGRITFAEYCFRIGGPMLSNEVK
jgi:hypothetical protein